jgi:transcriptional regulator with GAF, ATPase, and Fis domain
MGELDRLVVRHRNVAPMLSALLAGTDATIVLRDLDGTTVLHREGVEIAERHGPFPIVADGRELGSVEGGSFARPIAAVLSYAVSRELDKRSLAREALDRYRELNLIYDLAEALGPTLEVEAIARIVTDEAGRLAEGGSGFFLLADEATGELTAAPGTDAGRLAGGRRGQGILGRVAASGVAELVDMPATDPDATPEERAVPAIVAAPMRTGGRTIGIVGATSAAPGTFNAGDVKVLTALAALAAPAIDHARIHEAAVREALERERSLEDEVATLRAGRSGPTS